MATANPTGTRTYPTEGAYRTERGPATSSVTRTEKGMSLARGPALILGTILTAVGLYLLYKARTFPPFSNFPNGTAAKDGDFLFGIFGANGWTGMLTAVGGGLLLFGAAQHLLAKTMSLIVGVALGVATVIALVSGNVLGMAATNGWTKLGWGVSAVILLFNTLVPRRRRTVTVVDEPAAHEHVAHDAPVAEPVAHDEPVARHTPVARNEPAAYDRGPTTAEPREAAAQPPGEEPTAVRPVGEEPTTVRRAESVD